MNSISKNNQHESFKIHLTSKIGPSSKSSISSSACGVRGGVLIVVFSGVSGTSIELSFELEFTLTCCFLDFFEIFDGFDLSAEAFDFIAGNGFSRKRRWLYTAGSTKRRCLLYADARLRSA